MALSECQYQIRDLVLGDGTDWEVLTPGTDLFNLRTRAPQSEERSWDHGTWSGAEFADEKVIPLRLKGTALSGDISGYIELVKEISAAFAPVEDGASQVELRYHLGGIEYLLTGRPRMMEPESDGAAYGVVRLNAAFVANNPKTYSANKSSQVLGLPQFEGGFTFPFTFPFQISGTLIDGRADIENEGSTNTHMVFRIDGPASGPRITLQRSDGKVQSLRVLTDLLSGQWLDIDTGSHVVLLNGLANRRKQVSGEFPILPPGISTLRFDAAEFNLTAQLTSTWRHAWWL